MSPNVSVESLTKAGESSRRTQRKYSPISKRTREKIGQSAVEATFAGMRISQNRRIPLTHC
jgi:hypothetical protein